MMKKPQNPLVTNSEPRRAPVRVRLQRINAYLTVTARFGGAV